MRFTRASGVLLHPTSLPGPYGIGDLGGQARRFVDALAEAGQTYWQILPLGPTGYGDSPYQSFSAFAGNTLLISPDELLSDGLLEKTDLAGAPDLPAHRVDFGAVYEWKNKLLSAAYDSFGTSSGDELRAPFAAFCLANNSWLDDFALFRAIKSQQDLKPWYEWPDKFKHRDARTIGIAAEQLAGEIEAEKFFQFVFFRQWNAVREYAAARNVKIIGDIPLFVAPDSADVWSGQRYFKLGPDGRSKVVAGVPPDFFSSTGQLWGNPIYNWEVMREGRFQWWTARFRSALESVDILRIDHFRGFLAAWEVPGKDKTAEYGEWVDVPGRELFDALQRELVELPLIAEDLGVITPDVVKLRTELGIPGMTVLQFAFGGDANNEHLPHNYDRSSVVYTSTHDNDTLAGWWASLPPAEAGAEKAGVREHCLEYLDTDPAEIHWRLVRAAWASVADIAIAPVQDLLGLGSDARMNTPATDSGNWSWRLTEGAMTGEILLRLRQLTELYGRIPPGR